MTGGGASRRREIAAESAHPSGPTLLPGPIAHAVSIATRSTSFAVRVGSLVGSYSLDAARFTTVSSLELARGMVEGVLSRAARDTIAQSDSALAAASAETILDRSLESLHFAVTQAVFWTSASFRLTGTTLVVASEASQLLLSSLDQLFGSTESSRAVAGIIALMRREFRNPATGAHGQRVGVLDLVLALGALAYLQRACRRTTSEELRRQAWDEVIWDVVVLNDGERVDVQEDEHSPGRLSPPLPGSPTIDDDEAVLARVKSQIVSTLPSGTTVSISNSVSSLQTITIDVDGPQLPVLSPPVGAEVIETRRPLSTTTKRRSWASQATDETSSYRVVYKIERDKFRSASFRGEHEGSSTRVLETELEDLKPLRIPVIKPRPCDASADIDLVAPKISDFQPPPSLPSPPHSAKSPTGAEPRSQSVAVVCSESHDHHSLVPPSSRSPTTPRRTPPSPETAANQKILRSPLKESRNNGEKLRPPADVAKRSLVRRKHEASAHTKAADKRSALKQVLKGGSHSLSNMWSKDSTTSHASRTPNKPRPQWRSPSNGNASNALAARATSTPSSSSATSRRLPPSTRADPSVAARRPVHTPEPRPRTSSRASYVSIHEMRRDSIVSQTGSYSICSSGARHSASPTIVRADFSTQESSRWPPSDAMPTPPSPDVNGFHHSAPHAPSLYSLATNDSQSSLILSSYYQKSAFNASDALQTLRREGFVDGTFPAGHILPNIARYMRFSSACYGSHFLKFMGISTELPALGVWDGTHHDVRHFVHHTESVAGNILLASFVDPQGGADATGSTNTGVPLVHYISLDHEAKAVVLACRGTLGFEDVMADMACDYDDMFWRGRRYKVHKGMHASARRLLYGDDGRVLVTIREALQEFPDYGLVLCGHSLGGGVTSLLGIMLAQPNADGPGFVISAEPQLGMRERGLALSSKCREIRLPLGRRIHVYAYGPPGVMSPSLRRITKGLITSVVHGNDLVPHLSLGLLHDIQALALALKNDENKTKAELRRRLWHAIQSNLTDRWYRATASRAPAEAEERWTVPALSALRDSMKSAKLVPPGEVFAIESQGVLRRNAFALLDEEPVGRPARRVVLKYVRDVEGHFGEVRFGSSMLTDHSPAKYEDALNKLRLGVV